jgi:hypothetical protein
LVFEFGEIGEKVKADSYEDNSLNSNLKKLRKGRIERQKKVPLVMKKNSKAYEIASIFL